MGGGGACRRFRARFRLRGRWRRSPRRRRRSAINQDPYPSTYHRYPGALTVIRDATVFDGEGGRIENGTVILADGVVQAVGGPGYAGPGWCL